MRMSNKKEEEEEEVEDEDTATSAECPLLPLLINSTQLN
jgi:hypothetical protein